MPVASPSKLPPADSLTNRAPEEICRAVPSPDSAHRWLRILTEEPHVAGTPQDLVTARFVQQRFEAAGIEATLAEYTAYVCYPRTVSIHLTAPEDRELANREDGVLRDKDSYAHDALVGFNAYSPSGDVSGQIVYVNYGLPEDYKALAASGVSVKGRIALARYGQSFRGVKAKVAEQNGAAGLLIYSDPADDGYARGDVYPDGPWRPASAIQRGSIAYIFEYAGDPLSPGFASTRTAHRIRPAAATNLPKMPTAPLSYGEAQHILRALAGPNVPPGWQGALPFAYHIGPGPATVHMHIEMDYRDVSLWNVIGRIPGKSAPERYVITGNHRDAWTYGAVDPNSGTATLLEVARSLGVLLKTGWRPERTIILASWDGEEYGLLGSTEWAEDHAADLEGRTVAYINVDSGVSGADLSAAAVPSLASVITDAARDVTDPLRGGTLYDAWFAREKRDRFETWKRDATLRTIQGRAVRPFDVEVGPLGSGSDYTAFLDHFGVPSMDFQLNGPYGVYHAVYDNLYWMEHFGDPQFANHATLARYWDTVLLRLADASVLPFDYVRYAEDIQRFLEQLGDDICHANAGKTTADTLRVDLASLTALAADMRDAADSLQPALDALSKNASPSRAARVNDLLVAVEHDLTDPSGLPGRLWYRHQIYAPGYYTGYAALPLPAAAQAVKDASQRDLTRGVTALQAALTRATHRLQETRAAAIRAQSADQGTMR
jgi:N-acetylated-alpha-linked acidic dipeptidase